MSGTATQTMEVNADAGRLTFTTDDTLGYFTLSYGSTDNPLHLDLLAGGANAFVLDYESTVANTMVMIGVSTASGSSHLGISSSLATSYPLPNGLTRAVIPFDVYNNYSEFDDVRRISISGTRFQSQASISIYHFATIPEPSSWFMLLTSMTIGCCTRWHRK